MKKEKTTQIPKREDGLPDLNNWRKYIEDNSIDTLGQMVEKFDSSQEPEKTLIFKAISAKEAEIADKLIDILFAEELSIETAISILKLTKQRIMKLKFNL